MTIVLSNGMEALVDPEDYDRATVFKWHANKTGAKWRACNFNKSCPFNYLHQLVMNTKYVDHINGNPLDNRKHNLRVCTQKQNSRNKRPSKNNSSGYKGVTFDTWGKNLKRRWIAQIKVDRKLIKIGRFGTREEAAKAYDREAIRHFGEFACLNFKE